MTIYGHPLSRTTVSWIFPSMGYSCNYDGIVEAGGILNVVKTTPVHY